MLIDKIVSKVFFAAVAAALLMAFFAPRLGQNIRVNNEKVVNFSDSWALYVDGELKSRDAPLPSRADVPKNTETELRRTLPEKFSDGMTVCFRSSQQFVRVVVNGKQLYSFGYSAQLAYSKSPGSIWNFVRIPADAKGAEISIFLKSPYDNFSGKLPGVNYGSKNSNVFNVVNQALPAAVACVLTALVGFLLILLHLSTRKQSRGFSLLYLGVFALTACLWSFAETKLFQLFVSNQIGVTGIAFTMSMLTPIAFLLFARETFSKISRRLVNVLCTAFLAVFAALSLLQLTNIADFAETIAVYHALLLVGITAFFAHSYCMSKKHDDKTLRFFSLSALILVLTAALDVFSFYTQDKDDAAYFFRIGLLVFIVILASFAGRTAYALISENMRISALENLAYVDLLTGVRNRNCFESELDTYRDDAERCRGVCVMVFDINNLKHVNDTFGHKSGDELIIACSGCICAAVSDNGRVYRIGGDEFAALCDGLTEQELEEILENVSEHCGSTRIKCGDTLSVAGAAAVYDPATDTGIESLFRRADTLMYEKKARMKGVFGRRREDMEK